MMQPRRPTIDEFEQAWARSIAARNENLTDIDSAVRACRAVGVGKFAAQQLLCAPQVLRADELRSIMPPRTRLQSVGDWLQWQWVRFFGK